MNLMRKLPGSRHALPGLERVIFRKLPGALVIGTVLPIALCLLYTYTGISGAESITEKSITGYWIVMVASIITVWTAIFTIAIGCIIVILMKGPAYVADAYPLVDAEKPEKDIEPNESASMNESNRSF